jgi:hypothetical protein
VISGKQVVNDIRLTESFANWHVLILALLNFQVVLGIFISTYEFFIQLCHHCTDYMVWNSRMISEWLFGKDVEESSRDVT